MWGATERRTQQCSGPHHLVIYAAIFLYLTFVYNPRQESESNKSWCKPSLKAVKQWGKYGCRKARFLFLFVQCLRKEKLGEKKFLSSIQSSLELLIPFAMASEHPHDLTSWISGVILPCICEWTVSKVFQANIQLEYENGKRLGILSQSMQEISNNTQRGIPALGLFPLLLLQPHPSLTEHSFLKPNLKKEG